MLRNTRNIGVASGLGEWEIRCAWRWGWKRKSQSKMMKKTKERIKRSRKDEKKNKW